MARGALDFYLSLAKAKKTRGSLALREKIKMLWGFCEFLKEKDFLRDVLLFDCLYYNLKAAFTPGNAKEYSRGEYKDRSLPNFGRGWPL